MAKRRDYAAEYRRRQELAKERGFESYWQERRSPRRLIRSQDFSLLPERARDSRTKALRVVSLARDEKTTAEEVAGRLGVPMRDVRYWAREALRPTRHGKTLPTRGDRIARLRPVIFEGDDESSFVIVRGSRAAERADFVFDIQWRFIAGHAEEAELELIRGLRFGGRVVESDPDRLEFLGRAGAIDIGEAYRDVVG
jgi:hypothetical protein